MSLGPGYCTCPSTLGSFHNGGSYPIGQSTNTYSANYQRCPLELYIWGPRQWPQGSSINPADIPWDGSGPGLHLLLEGRDDAEVPGLQCQLRSHVRHTCKGVVSIFCCTTIWVNGYRSLFFFFLKIRGRSLLYILGIAGNFFFSPGVLNSPSIKGF